MFVSADDNKLQNKVMEFIIMFFTAAKYCIFMSNMQTRCCSTLIKYKITVVKQ